MSACSGQGVLQNTIALQFAVGDCLVNPRQVLINDSARSKIKVANFRVAHLSLWQANIHAARAQSRPGIIPVQLVVKGRGREQGRVPVFMALIAAGGINAPAVADDEHHRASHTWRTLPMNKRMDKQFFVSIEF